MTTKIITIQIENDADEKRIFEYFKQVALDGVKERKEVRSVVVTGKKKTWRYTK